MMHLKKTMQRNAIEWLLAAMILLLASCSTTSPNLGGEIGGLTPGSERNAAIRALLLDADGRSFIPATERRLQAAQLALKLADARLLRWILDSIGPTPPDQQDASDLQHERSLLRAELALLEDDPEAAIRQLDRQVSEESFLDEEQQASLYNLRARAWLISNNLTASARELIHLSNLVSDKDLPALHQRILKTLLRMDEPQLRKQAEKSVASDTRGWLSLAALIKGSEYNPAWQIKVLANWLRVWSSHPATPLVLDTQEQLDDIIRNLPRHIVLLLPLEGSLGSYGRAIKHGFIAGHYLQRQQMPDGSQAPETQLSILDTSQTDIRILIDQAKSMGAEMIIGPLDRQRVTDLAKLKLPMPVLALNRTHDGSTNRKLYQFGLTPEDESVQVAEQVIHESRTKGLVIAPETPWGERNLAAFSSRFTELGGTIVDTARFDAQRDYAGMIKSLLNVDASEARLKALQQVTGEQFEFTVRRRQDIDFVFLLSNSVQARSINPTLAFFYADDLPVYATSHVRDLGASRIDVIDLNGIRFCDLPWKLSIASPAREAITSTWEEAKGQLAPFYALGLDVHRLYPRLKQIQSSSISTAGGRLNGATGSLRMDKDNVVRRTLVWAEFKNGKVAVMPPAYSAGAGQ